ncbi:hypothetical protein B0H17DRAFT_170066 [Mycena rosella]|uniref:Uncharacterized protein n=1 Tax=Mycena rosella TaxID=1033263 RepID=A0AAD7D2E8_MYCRO|nr:hypothetical protein B0H17DRAFT_170066 [Mycena rosella]
MTSGSQPPPTSLRWQNRRELMIIRLAFPPHLRRAEYVIMDAFCGYISHRACSLAASHIGFPLPGATLKFNSTFTVQLVRPNSIEGSIEVGIAIGLLGCPVSQGATCPPPDAQLGSILFTGKFNPTIHPMAMFYENFTLTVPSADSFFSGTRRAQLAVARLHLIGAGPSPILELNNITVKLSN